MNTLDLYTIYPKLLFASACCRHLNQLHNNSCNTTVSFSPFHPLSICLRMPELITEYDDFRKLASWQSEKPLDDLLAELSAAKTNYRLGLLSRRGSYNRGNAE